MEETSDSAITGQSILATIGERLPAMVIPGGKSFLFLFFFLLPSPFFSFADFYLSPSPSFLFCHFIVFLLSHLSFLLSPLSFLLSPLSFVLSPLSFVLSHLSFVLCPFSFLICPFPFLLSPLSFVLSPFSRLSHFVAQISANVNIYRIDSSFLHIICAFLA